MKGNEILSEFQFLGNRVSYFNLSTRLINTKEYRVNVSFDFDYDVKEIQEHKENVLGIIEFVVKIKAAVKNKILYKIELIMEGAFAGEAQLIPEDKFQEMLEINGIITLSQISRSYILSVTSQSGINPPVRIPMINVIKLREAKKKTES